MMDTPETNVKLAALNLLRYKMLKSIEKNEGRYTPDIDVEELNDVLIVAGLPVVTPAEVKAKEIDVLLEREG